MANVRKMLDLSTAHLTEEQRLFGSRDGDRASWGSAVVHVMEYGFLMWVPDDPKESAGAEEEAVPAGLLAIQLHARKHECDYVLFDADGPADDDLPVFEEGPQACTSCGGSRAFPSGCLSCCRDCGFPCDIEKNAEAFHGDDENRDAVRV